MTMDTHRRTRLLKMAEEWDRLADEQEHDTDPAHGRRISRPRCRNGPLRRASGEGGCGSSRRASMSSSTPSTCSNSTAKTCGVIRWKCARPRFEVCWPKLALACASMSIWKATAQPSSPTPARWDSNASCRNARTLGVSLRPLAGLAQNENDPGIVCLLLD